MVSRAVRNSARDDTPRRACFATDLSRQEAYDDAWALDGRLGAIAARKVVSADIFRAVQAFSLATRRH